MSAFKLNREITRDRTVDSERVFKTFLLIILQSDTQTFLFFV